MPGLPLLYRSLADPGAVLRGIAQSDFALVAAIHPCTHRRSEDPVWDGNLREGNNPAPLWWFWLILAAMVFSVVYLMLYPGLGSYAGEFSATRAQLLGMSLMELSEDTGAMRAAQRLFPDLRDVMDRNGNPLLGAPRLNDALWLYGGDAASLRASIGRAAAARCPPSARSWTMCRSGCRMRGSCRADIPDSLRAWR